MKKLTVFITILWEACSFAVRPESANQYSEINPAVIQKYQTLCERVKDEKKFLEQERNAIQKIQEIRGPISEMVKCAMMRHVEELKNIKNQLEKINPKHDISQAVVRSPRDDLKSLYLYLSSGYVKNIIAQLDAKYLTILEEDVARRSRGLGFLRESVLRESDIAIREKRLDPVIALSQNSAVKDKIKASLYNSYEFNTKYIPNELLNFSIDTVIRNIPKLLESSAKDQPLPVKSASVTMEDLEDAVKGFGGEEKKKQLAAYKISWNNKRLVHLLVFQLSQHPFISLERKVQYLMDGIIGQIESNSLVKPGEPFNEELECISSKATENIRTTGHLLDAYEDQIRAFRQGMIKQRASKAKTDALTERNLGDFQ